jgi:ribonucleoside-diphosphate reductase alpha chain
MSNPMNELGEKIFLDRYALKDTKKESLETGDVVLVCVDQKSRQRVIGKVVKHDGYGKQVEIELRDGTTTTQDWDSVDKPLELTAEQAMARTARGVASVEDEDERDTWTRNFEWLLDDWRFVPGGRILAAAGTDQQLSLFNCYVIPSPKDSRSGILDTLGEMTEIMSRGGGVGVNLSSLRPRYAYVKGVNGRSSGSVSWGGLYSFTTGLIEQGGSRRGALMLILNDWHPDIIDFINAKREDGKIVNANISVGISDEFMTAVEADADWNLEFPDTGDDHYIDWNGDLKQWKSNGYKTIIYKTLKARDVWNQIIESAWASAEPGIFFIERYNKESNSAYFAPIVSCNPCAEQGLPAYGCCNLGALNLSRFVFPNKSVDWESLGLAVRYAVRFLDNVVDLNHYFMDEIKTQQLDERRIGLGIMGLAEMLIKLELAYGSKRGNEFVDKLGEFIASEAYLMSSAIAQEKSSFPKFDASKLLQSGYAKRLPANVRKAIKENGLRNVTLLTVAPTGTTGTMVNTSTGIEPYYAWTFTRNSRLGSTEIDVDIVAEWRAANPNAKDLPKWFVSAMDLTPEEHVSVQATLQRWIDSSISKTCNVPNDYTVDQTRELYELMYKLGCKGGTIYRDGSRSEQVLSTKPSDKDKAEAEDKKHKKEPIIKMRERPKMARGLTIEKESPVGRVFVTVNVDANGSPVEIFITAGKAGSDITSMAEGIGRACSLALQINGPMTPMERLSEIAEQFNGIGGANSVGFGKNQVRSMPEAVSRAIVEITEEIIKMQTVGELAPSTLPELAAAVTATARKRAKAKTPAPDICPSCGSASFIREEGCQHCTACGHSRC